MKIIKMRPSHRPVIKAMVKTFAPETVVECGCGPNSTPLWSKTCKKVIGIEHNPEWVESIKDKCGDNVEFMTKVFWDLKFSTYPDDLPLSRRREMYDYFSTAPINSLSIDLLFVDSFAAVRVYALMALAKRAGITMYHDTEVDKYWYRYFEEKLPIYYQNGFRHYSYRPQCQPHIARQEPCTDIIFRPEHYAKIDEFIENLKAEHRAYYQETAKIEDAALQIILIEEDRPL